MKMMNRVKKIHFVGIGGIGMSGIAEILLNQGFEISGSDISTSEITNRLNEIGADITIGHAEQNVVGADVVVYSSAVKQDNAELLEAGRLGIPVIRRAEMLAELTRLQYSIAIAGTHGKTTTTSMLGSIMIRAELDPTVIVGGKLHAFGGSNAHLGKGDYIVVEADEFDRSFLKLNPTVALITTIEEEHLDIYSDIVDIQNAFLEFVNRIPFYGFAVVNLDDPNIQEIQTKIEKRIITVGFNDQADYQAKRAGYHENKAEFDLYYKGEKLKRFELAIPGKHNISNALTAIAAALEVGVDIHVVYDALREYGGAYRRFEIHGWHNTVMVVDDYAHHPTEVIETLRGLRAGWDNRIICVYQPHTFTRTRDFSEQYGKAFMNANIVIVTGIYPARELPIQGITGQNIVDSAIKYGHKNATYEETNPVAAVERVVKKNDIIIMMGAGDIYKQIPGMIEMLKSKQFE